MEQRENSYGKDANTALGTEQLPVLQALGWTCTLLLFSLHCKECLLLQWAIFCFDVALNPPQTAQHVDRRQWSVHARLVWHLHALAAALPSAPTHPGAHTAHSSAPEQAQPFPGAAAAPKLCTVLKKPLSKWWQKCLKGTIKSAKLLIYTLNY